MYPPQGTPWLHFHFHFHSAHTPSTCSLSLRTHALRLTITCNLGVPTTSLNSYLILRYVSIMEEDTGEEWTPTGARTIRARSETNRITTLTRESLEEAGLEDAEDMAIFAREGEIRLYPWVDGIPAEVAEAFYPCGVRTIHTSGTSTVITLTDRALVTAGFTEGTKLQQRGKPSPAGLKLSTEEPDLRRGGPE